MIRIALFTTLLILSAHIAGGGITSDNGAQASEAIQEQNDSGIAASDWVENDPCTLQYIFCDWKKEGVVTAYSSSIDETDDTPLITASGQTVRKGIVANNCEPFGKKVMIDGVEYEVQDRKNSRYGCDWWDIWMPSKNEAMQWGKRKLIVMIK